MWYFHSLILSEGMFIKCVFEIEEWRDREIKRKKRGRKRMGRQRKKKKEWKDRGRERRETLRESR